MARANATSSLVASSIKASSSPSSSPSSSSTASTLLKKLYRVAFPKHVRCQNPDSMLLQFPFEIIWLIWEQLPAMDRAMLALTCRALHNIFRGRIALPNASRAEKLEYAFTVARDLPDLWACEYCCNLHRILPNDTPAQALRRRCQGPKLTYQAPGFEFRDLLHVSHRHVQLALKYTRLMNNGGDGDALTHSHSRKGTLAREHRKYLGKLLQPRHGKFLPELEKQPLDASFSAYPLVVGGRYLIKLAWQYERAGLRDRVDRLSKQLSQEHLGFLRLCRHEKFDFSIGHPIHRRARGAPSSRPGAGTGTAKNGMRGNDTSHSLTGNPWLQPGSAAACARDTLVNNNVYNGLCSFRIAVDGAFSSPGVETFGSCHRCPFDFSVLSTWERVEICAWYDLGPEGSAMDLAWGVHVYCGMETPIPGLYHRSGDIRRQYKAAERGGDGFWAGWLWCGEG